MRFKSAPLAFLVMVMLASQQLIAACLPQDAGLPFEVYRNSRAPLTDNHANFRFFPGSVYDSGFGTADLLQQSQSTANRHLFLWVNRCHFASRGSVCGYIQEGNNPVIRHGSASYSFYFTSLNRADACTRAQLYYAFEAENFAVNVLGRYGVDPILPHQDPLDFVNYSGGYRDVCYLWAHNLKDHVEGVTFDYEPQDLRPPSRTNLLSSYFSRFLRDPNRFPRKTMHLYTNPTDHRRGPTNGIVRFDNARSLLDLYDRVSVFSYDHSDPYLIEVDLWNQIAYWGATSAADRAKIFQIVGVGPLTRQEILARRDVILRYGLAGAAVWNNLGGRPSSCGSEYQDRVRCLVYGICSGF